MRLDPLVLQDYTEALKQHSNSRLLDLFQRRYAHSLIVSLTRYEKQKKSLVFVPFSYQNLSNLSTIPIKMVKVGVGLMLLVQFGGNNVITAYSSSIFNKAGN
jgi:hypothetical protein